MHMGSILCVVYPVAQTIMQRMEWRVVSKLRKHLPMHRLTTG